MLEIKGENRFKPWRQDVEIEPGDDPEDPRDADPGGRAGSGSERRGARRRAPSRERGRAAARQPEPPRRAAAGRRRPPAPSRPVAAAGRRRQRQPSATAHRRGAGAASRRGASGRKKRVASAAGRGDGARPATTAGDAPRPARRGRRRVLRSPSARVPWSEVWIDGKNTTKHTPVVDYKIPCGKHKLAFKRPDLQIDQTESITRARRAEVQAVVTRWPTSD